ncbi:MAG TPA: AsmA family protein [Candidatus Binatia bacterium]|nr:AsmA family protein [Candidatus Binatia bacterium]
MRKLLIVAGAAVAVMLAVTLLALANLNSLINRNKDYLLARAQESMGRTMTVGEIGLTLWGGIGVRLKQFTLSDDPAFSNEPFVRAADLQVNMKLLPLLLKRELEIRNMVLHRPVINVLRDKSGQFNFATIGGEKEKKEKAEKEKKERAGERGAPPLAVSLVDVDDGEIHYKDAAEGVDFHATQLDFKVKDINFERPIDVDLKAAVLGAAKQNFRLKGRVGPLGPKADFSDLPVDGDVELDTIALENLEKTLPGVSKKLPKDVALAGSVGVKSRVTGHFGKNVLPDVSGTLNLAGISARVPALAEPVKDINAKISFTGKTADLPETMFKIGKSQVRLSAKAAGFAPLNLSYRVSSPELNLADVKGPAKDRKKPEVLKDLKGEGTLLVQHGAITSRGNFTSSGGTIADGDFKNLQTSVAFADRVATIESFSTDAFSGSVKAKGRYDMREATPRFAATANIKAMDVAALSNAISPSAPKNLRGFLDMDLDVTGAGKDWDAIQNALKGQAKMEVKNGALLDVNLAESVFSNVPGGVTIVPNDIRKKYPDVFSAKDTEFKQMQGTAVIADGRARTDDLIVSAAEFETQGKGWVAFDRKVDFRALLTFSQPLSQDIVNKAKQSKGFLNDQGQLEMPFTLSGKLPGAKPKPDMNYVARAMQKSFFGQSFDNPGGKKSKKSSDASGTDESAPADSGGKKKKNTKDEVIRGLQNFFGNK